MENVPPRNDDSRSRFRSLSMGRLRRLEDVSGPVIGLFAPMDGRKAARDLQTARVLDRLQMMAKFIDENFPHIDGKASHVVVADEPVHDALGAMRAGKQFRQAGVQVLVSWNEVWAYPGEIEGLLLQQLSMGQVPLAHVSGNSASWPGVVYAFAVSGMDAQNGILSHRLVGSVDESGKRPKPGPDLAAALLDWLAAAATYADMWGTPYVSFGGASMSMETGAASRTTARRWLGINTIDVDMIEIAKRIELRKVDERETDTLYRWLTESLMPRRVLFDKVAGTEQHLRTQCRMYLAMRDILREHGASCGGFQGQRQWTDHLPSGDVPEALLNDVYDHRGPKVPTAFATENDFNAGLTQRVNVGLSRGLPAIFMDFRKAYFPPELAAILRAVKMKPPKGARWTTAGLVDFVNSGTHPPYYGALDRKEPRNNYRGIRLHPVVPSYFPGGGFSVEFRAAPTPMTFDRLLTRPDGVPALQACEGDSVALPDKVATWLEKASNATWPHLWGVLDEDLQTVCDTWGCNHAIGMPGRHRRRLQYWADIARVPIIGTPSFQAGGRTEPLLYQMLGGGTEARVRLGPRM
jgi:L-fucose/D-arabinose isomerase